MRRTLDNWQFWVGVAYIGLACVVVALWVNFDRVSAEQRRTEQVVAARHADVIANADSQYQQCVKSIPTLTGINKFIDGVRETNHVLLINALATHRATAPSSAVYVAQEKNIARLRVAFQDVNGVYFPVPTHRECTALRAKLVRGH